MAFPPQENKHQDLNSTGPLTACMGQVGLGFAQGTADTSYCLMASGPRFCPGRRQQLLLPLYSIA